MKTYKDIYEFPLRISKYGNWVYDQKSNFVFQFEPRFTKGEYTIGYKELETKLLDAINGNSNFDERVYLKDGQVFIEGDNIPVITIRGWGNLTGVGAHALSGEEAANIQDTFAEFICERLNSKE